MAEEQKTSKLKTVKQASNFLRGTEYRGGPGDAARSARDWPMFPLHPRNRQPFVQQIHGRESAGTVPATFSEAFLFRSFRSLAVRPMRNKWASCSTAASLNFNAELLSLGRDVGDYVIVHELLHFFVPHHGKLWKSLMRAHRGDYEDLESRLRQQAGATS